MRVEDESGGTVVVGKNVDDSTVVGAAAADVASAVAVVVGVVIDDHSSKMVGVGLEVLDGYILWMCAVDRGQTSLYFLVHLSS